MAKAKPAAAKAQGAEHPVASTVLPLFFKRPMVIDKTRHEKAHLTHSTSLAFSKETNSVPLNTLEFIEASKQYPIVFTSDEQPVPVAVLGWEQENYFLATDGSWLENHYIPAYIRQYPFIFVQHEEAERFLLAIDEEAPNFHAGKVEDSEPLFENGEASALSNRALEFCTSFYQHMNITRNFCADLKAHKLLSPYSSKATFEGKEMQLNGFMMIDEKAFNALDEKTFLEFRSKGWLAFIYLAMASASNWKLLMERARTSLQTAA